MPKGSPSWIHITIGNIDIPLNAVFRLTSVIISCLSLFYGLSKMDLRNMARGEIETHLSIKLFFTELLTKLAMFLRILICFSLYYVDQSLLTCAIIYTCLDFLPIIRLMFIFLYRYYIYYKDLKLNLISLADKNILDPSRCIFQGCRDKSIDWKLIVFVNSLFTIWYSLLGIIFSSIFISSDFRSNESCDRISRFYAFFMFTLVIDVLAFIYSCTSLVLARFDIIVLILKPVEQEEQEEPNFLLINFLFKDCAFLYKCM